MRVFVTGLTGTLGTALARFHAARGDGVWGCARNESRAVEWLAAYSRLATLYVTGADALADPWSDAGRLLPSMDRVYHCAAMKHVDLCESHPSEAVEANVRLTATVTGACRSAEVTAVHISSDKACLPGGVYGATKLLAERVALREGAAVVRMVNIVGSSGSVFEGWRKAVDDGLPVKLTNAKMTRYFISIADAARFIVQEAIPGVVVVPKHVRAAVMGRVAEAVGRVELVGMRPGETLHQHLVAPEEAMVTGETRSVLMPEGRLGGVCSEDAERWDPAELLALAGVPCRS